MAFIKVKNKMDSPPKELPKECSSWIEYWEKRTGKMAHKCGAMFCNSKPEIGAQLVKSKESSKVYLLPLCFLHHNKSPDEDFNAWDHDLLYLG